MITIIKSILSGDDSFDVRSLLDRLYLNKELISKGELDRLEFIKETHLNSGSYPSITLYLNKFKEDNVLIERAGVLSFHDCLQYSDNLFDKRNKQNISRVVMQIASEIPDKGLTPDALEKIRSFISVDKNVDVLESAQSFREFYDIKKSVPSGLVTYIKELDEVIGGMAPGTVTVIAGYVGQYKSLWGTNIAYVNSKKQNYNVCLISLEVPKEQIMFNLLSRHSYETKFMEFPFIPHNKIRQCILSEEEERFVFHDVLDDFYNTGGSLVILDETDFKTYSQGELRNKLDSVDEDLIKKTGYGLDAVIWDYAQLLKFANNRSYKESTMDEINDYLSFIRRTAIDFKRDSEGNTRQLSMIVLAQVNRDGFRRAQKNGGHYDLRALAEANGLERDASIIMTIYADDANKAAKEAVVCLLKNRTGGSLAEPITIYVDPEVYIAGSDSEGFDTMIEPSDFENVFDSGNSISDLF